MGDMRLFGDPVLEQVASEIPDGRELTDLLSRMRAAMHRLDGIGIAAPQIGVPARVIWVDLPEMGPLVDPMMVRRAESGSIAAEGCLSIPGIEIDVWRPRWIEVAAFRPTGERFHRRVRNRAARVVCHEMDHLDGRLIAHRLAPNEQARLRAGFAAGPPT